MDSRIWGPFFEFQPIDNVADGPVIPLRDTINEYRFNSSKFRGYEHGSKNFLAAGCSQTFGEGVPFETIWSSKLAEMLGEKEYANLGIRAASTMAIVTRVFAYIHKYEKPKYLVCLFPNLNRIEYYIDQEISISRWNMGKNDAQSIHLLERNAKRPKYIKSPFYIQDVISQKFVDMVNMDYIRMLDLYCKSNNIQFRWSTWDSDFSMLYENYPEKMDSYVALGTDLAQLHKLDSSREVECHSELYDKYGENFFIGADHLCDSKEHGHMGVHKHAHIAEKFFSSI
jgi:hypothetical protein